MPTTEDLEKLESAIFSGTRRVKYQDKEVEYASIDEMIRVRNLLITKLSSTSPIQLQAKAPVYDGGFE